MKFNEKYKFTEEWFDIAIPGWEQLLIPIKDKINNVLEIGCFEGRATVWLCENINPINYDIIDSFEGSPIEHGMKDVIENLKENNFIENNFKHNISFFNDVNFNINKGYSQIILPTFPQEEKYDLIYIDASHRADDTFVDAYYANKLLKVGGILIFDDYGWKDQNNMHPSNSPQLGIEIFNTMYDNEFQLIMRGYQIAFQKIR